MSAATDIQWTDSTCNPTMGCCGCELWTRKLKICYAGVLHNRHGGKNPGYAPKFEQVTEFPGRVAKAAALSDLRGLRRPMKPWLDGLPRTIFLSDMSDALSPGISFEYLATEIIDNVASDLGRRHQWQWLTKQPQRMAQFWQWLRERTIPWPGNLWAGTSITTQSKCSRIEQLLKVGPKGMIRFVSVEPQWQAIDLRKWLPKLNWVIQGGQSGAKAVEFNLSWAHDLRDQCRKAGVPFFLKQLGSKPLKGGKSLKLLHDHGGDWMEWPRELRVRELPPLDRSARH